MGIMDKNDRILLFLFGLSLAVVFSSIASVSNRLAEVSVSSLIVVFGVICCITALGYEKTMMEAPGNIKQWIKAGRLRACARMLMMPRMSVRMKKSAFVLVLMFFLTLLAVRLAGKIMPADPLTFLACYFTLMLILIGVAAFTQPRQIMQFVERVDRTARAFWREMNLLLVAAAMFLCAINPRWSNYNTAATFMLLLFGAMAFYGFVAKSAGWQNMKWASIFGCVLIAGLTVMVTVLQWRIVDLIASSPKLLEDLRELAKLILRVIFPRI